MSELIRNTVYDEDGSGLEFYWMNEIEVDGIYSSAKPNLGGDRHVVVQSMVEIKDDLDWTAPMRWSPGFNLDEQAWLSAGVITSK